MSTIAVAGAGAMGRIVVKDLVESAPDVEVLVGDYDMKAAQAVAQAAGGRTRAVRLDASKPAQAARALKGAFGVINCCRHELNLPIMQAAHAISAHYTDLGGLFHVTRKQLKLDRAWRKKGLTALVGMGAAPGVVNVLARASADAMERVDEIHVMVASIDRTPGRAGGPLDASYSIETILDEASQPAALFTGGEFTFVPAMSGAEPVDFPAPIGRRRPARTIHSEVATLPLSYRDKGVREVSFRIAFSDALDERLRFLHALGLTDARPLKVGKVAIAPRALLTALLRRLPRPAPAPGPPDEYEVLRVVVRGRRDGREVEEIVDCHVPGIPKWGLGVDVDTGCPPSIAMQMLLRGEITERGVVPPERAVPAEPFFRELAARGMRVERQSRAREGQRA